MTMIPSVVVLFALVHISVCGLMGMPSALSSALPSSLPSSLPGMGVPEDVNLNMDQQLTKYGYPHDIEYVTTDDGYILKCYRIQKCPKNKGLPVLLQHGLICNSLDYFVAGQGASLGYLVADACFDTWVCNNRGNFESRNHTTLDPDTPEFWRFSWHEMGMYDLPAIFERILSKTGHKSLNYVGHSEGTTQFFVFCSMYPEKCKTIINHMHALAPAVIMRHASQPALRAMASSFNEDKKALEAVDMYEFLAKGSVNELSPSLCNVGLDVLPEANPCARLLAFAAGDDPEQFNKTIVQLALANTPSGSSLNQSTHYAQNFLSDYFQMYDHNHDTPNGNMEIYGQPTPPRYPVWEIETPITLVCGENDLLANCTDVQALAAMMNKADVKYRTVNNPNFGHMNFLYAKDVKTLVNDPIMEDFANMKIHFYDHNHDTPNGNMEIYGQPTPPRYPVWDIEAPITLVCGENNLLANCTDVQALAAMMTKADVKYRTVDNPEFGHMNFLYAKDVKTLVNDQIMEDFANMKM